MSRALVSRLLQHPAMRRLRLAHSRYRASRWGHPEWSRVLRDNDSWPSTVEAARGGPRVLVATSVGAHYPSTHIESALGVALTLRGAEVDFLLCDASLDACMIADASWYPDPGRYAAQGPRELCKQCFAPAAAMLSSTGLSVRRYSELLTEQDREEALSVERSLSLEGIAEFERDSVRYGEHAIAGTLRFLGRGTLEADATSEAILRRYLRAAWVTGAAIDRLLARQDYDCVLFNHGIYVPQGVIGDVARRRGTRVVNWNPAYRRHCFIFSHDDTYHHTLLDEPTAVWESLEYTEAIDQQIGEYLSSREGASGDWIWFLDEPTTGADSVVAELGVDPARPVIGLFTNVFWDAQLHYEGVAFPDMLAWILETIEYFRGRPDLHLVVRIHPAEITGPVASRQPLADEIAAAIPQLPDNVSVVGPANPLSTYAIAALCDTVLVYGTKMGVELTSRGIPVITAGEAWIRGKGLTLDAASAEQYFEFLAQLPRGERMPEGQVERARLYAYHFFFRRMIPLEFTTPRDGWPPYELTVSGLDELRPGASLGLDTVCAGILTGSEFVY